MPSITRGTTAWSLPWCAKQPFCRFAPTGQGSPGRCKRLWLTLFTHLFRTFHKINRVVHFLSVVCTVSWGRCLPFYTVPDSIPYRLEPPQGYGRTGKGLVLPSFSFVQKLNPLRKGIASVMVIARGGGKSCWRKKKKKYLKCIYCIT